jgi:hypothetical protein
MKGLPERAGILMLMLVLVPLFVSSSQEWHWVIDNTFLNPSNINIIPPASPYLFDIDSDGDLDLVIGQGNGSIKLFYNEGFPGNIEWRPDSSYFADLVFDHPVEPTYGDIDQDDTLELIVSFCDAFFFPADSLKVFRNIGSPAFPVWSERPGLPGLAPNQIGLADNQRFIDWDDDGIMDLILRTESFPCSFYRNIGMPGHSSWVADTTMTARLPNPRACGIDGFDIAEFNADGCHDVLLSHAVCDDWSEILIYLNTGTNDAPVYPDSPQLYLRPETGPADRVISVDLDLDGSNDFISCGAFSYMWLYNNSGTPQVPTFDGVQDMRLGPLYAYHGNSLAFLDRDLDGDFDLAGGWSFWAWPHDREFLQWYCFNNIGNAQQAAYQPGSWLPNILMVYVADICETSSDINGDSLPDYVFSYAADLHCYINRRDAIFAGADSLFADLNNSGDFRHPELVDLNLDDQMDLVVIDDILHQLTAFENTGTPQMPAWTRRDEWVTGLDPSASYVNAADLNRDGNPDVVLKVGNSIRGYLNVGNVGNPSFEYVDAIFNDIRDLSIQYFDMADLNGDGKSDLIINNGGVFTFVENQSTVSVREDVIVTDGSALTTCYPNPFIGSNSVRLQMRQPGHAVVKIYDNNGRLIKVLVDAHLEAGPKILPWDGCDDSGNSVRSGVYFYRLIVDGGAIATLKMTFLR